MEALTAELRLCSLFVVMTTGLWIRQEWKKPNLKDLKRQSLLITASQFGFNVMEHLEGPAEILRVLGPSLSGWWSTICSTRPWCGGDAMMIHQNLSLKPLILTHQFITHNGKLTAFLYSWQRLSKYWTILNCFIVGSSSSMTGPSHSFLCTISKVKNTWFLNSKNPPQHFSQAKVLDSAWAIVALLVILNYHVVTPGLACTEADL